MRTIKISKIMKIKFLALIGVLFLTSFGNEAKAQEGKFYYAWVSVYDDGGDYTGHTFITPVQYVTNDCDYFISHSNAYAEESISVQFLNYVKAEYRLEDGYYFKNQDALGREFATVSAKYDSEYGDIVSGSTSKTDLLKWRREQMWEAKKITKVDDFEYLCD